MATDIPAVIDKLERVYKQCPGEDYFRGLKSEINQLQDKLQDLDDEVEDSTSNIKFDDRELVVLVGDVYDTVRSLESLIRGYNDWGKDSTDIPRLRDWKDQTGDKRVRLLNHQRAIGKLEKTHPRDHSDSFTSSESRRREQDDLQTKVHRVAESIRRRGGDTLRACERGKDDKQRIFQQELVSTGVSESTLSRHKAFLTDYIRNNGVTELALKLEPQPSQPRLSINTQQWAEKMSAVPLSIDTINSASSDNINSIKELNHRDENIKYQQSMKNQRPIPQVRRQGANGSGGSDQLRNSWSGGDSHFTPVRVPEPKSVTTTSILEDVREDEARRYSLNHTNSAPLSSSFSGTAPDVGIQRQRRASDQSDAASPSSPRAASHPRLAGHGASLRADNRDGSSLHGSSPRASGDRLSVYGTSPRSSNGVHTSGRGLAGALFGNSPRTSISGGINGVAGVPSTLQASAHNNIPVLAPDNRGQPIPADARWTRVERTAISTRALEEDNHRPRYRYEATQRYIYVLGTVASIDLQHLAERTQLLRLRTIPRYRDRNERTIPERPGRSSHDVTPLPGSLPKAVGFPGVEAGSKAQPAPLKPILKKVTFEDDDLKESDTEGAAECTATDSETDSQCSSDRRRSGKRDSGYSGHRYREDDRRRGERHSGRERDEERDRHRHHGGRGRSLPVPIVGASGRGSTGHLPTPTSSHTRRSSWEPQPSDYGGRDSGSDGRDSRDSRRRDDDSRDGRGDSRGGRDGGGRDEERERGERGDAKAKQLKAAGFGAMLGTTLSVLADTVMEAAFI